MNLLTITRAYARRRQRFNPRGSGRRPTKPKTN